jgi:hypothetical protein
VGWNTRPTVSHEHPLRRNGWASNVAVASAGEIQKSPDEVPLWHQPVVLWQKKFRTLGLVALGSALVTIAAPRFVPSWPPTSIIAAPFPFNPKY